MGRHVAGTEDDPPIREGAGPEGSDGPSSQKRDAEQQTPSAPVPTIPEAPVNDPQLGATQSAADKSTAKFHTSELRGRYLSRTDPAPSSSGFAAMESAQLLSHASGAAGTEQHPAANETNARGASSARVALPLFAMGWPASEGLVEHAREAVRDVFEACRQRLTLEHHVLLIGRNVAFNGATGLLTMLACDLLSSLKEADEASSDVAWHVIENRAPTAEAIGQAIGTLGTKRKLIFWARNYESRDTSWSPHIVGADRELLKQRLTASGAMLIEVVDVPPGRRLRYRDYQKYKDFVFHMPWHDYWLSGIFGREIDQDSYIDLKPLLVEAARDPEREFRLFARLSDQSSRLRELLDPSNDNTLDELKRIIRQNIEASKNSTNADALLHRHFGTGGLVAPSITSESLAPGQKPAPIEIGAPLAIKQVLLIAAAFANPINSRTYDQLCQALLPDSQVPQDLLPPYMRVAPPASLNTSDIPQAGWTWRDLWPIVSDDARELLHITVIPESHEIRLSTSEWGETPALCSLIATRYATVWREILTRAQAALPFLEVDTFKAGLKMILTAENTEKGAARPLERRVASMLVDLLSSPPKNATGHRPVLTPSQRFSTGLQVLTQSGLFNEPIIFAIYERLAEVSNRKSTHALLMSELVANYHLLGAPLDRVAHVIRQLSACDVGGDKLALLADALAGSRSSPEQCWLWMISFVPWLDPKTASHEQQQIAYLVWDECLFADEAGLRDISYGEINPDKTIASNIMKGPHADAQCAIKAVVTLNGASWFGASRAPKERFFNLLFLLRHGAREADIEQHPDLDGKLNAIVITDVIERLMSKERNIGTALDAALTKLVSGHRDLFELLKAAMLAEWRFQIFGVTNDTLQEDDKTRLRSIAQWIAKHLDLEPRVKLASDFEFQSKIYQKFAKICMDEGAPELRSIYINKRDRLSRMASLLLNAS